MNTGFRSVLANELEEFLAYKRALGRKYEGKEARLRSFDRVLVQIVTEGGDERCLERAVIHWLSSGDRQPSAIRVDFSLIRQFCLFQQRYDRQGYVPERNIIPRAKTRFRPYLLSLDDIRDLLQEIQTLRGPNPIRRTTYRVLVLVLFCTGLRPGEALRLRLADINMQRRVFFIDQSKGKSRWIPFSKELAVEIKRYLQIRMALDPCAPRSPFFIRPDGLAYTNKDIGYVLGRLWRRLGLKPARGKGGPRPYDLRHAFARYRLIRWYREGVDLHARLPWLSAYMGHDDLLGTEVYLTATPELLEVASCRFATRFRGMKNT